MAKRERDSRRTDDKGRADAPAADEIEAPSTIETIRRRVGDRAELSRASLLRDLEVEKHLALDRDNLAAAVRATELQGRAIGLFREPDPNAVRRISDEDLIRNIAGENELVAAALRESLETGRPCRAQAAADPAADLNGRARGSTRA